LIQKLTWSSFCNGAAVPTAAVLCPDLPQRARWCRETRYSVCYIFWQGPVTGQRTR
jgi:hypothetical protein